MATAGGIAAGLLGSAASEAAAFAAGLAIGPTLAPEVEFLKNEAWNAVQSRALEPGVAAEIAAEDVDRYDAMQQQAAYHGVAAALFKDLYGVNITAPGMGELLATLRRGTINSGNFTHGLRKAKLDPMWDAALADLQHVYLSPDILAVMLQRNVIPNQGQLPGVKLSTSGKVPRFPQVKIDAYAMAKTFGWSNAQLDAQARIQGLPPGMDLVARAVFRNILDRGDFNLAAEQSNRRVEWADYEFDAYRQIPTAHDFVEGALRGWLTNAEMYAGSAKHGMTQADTDLLYKISGRPVTVHEIVIGLARGATYPSSYTDVPEPFRKAIQESNIRPEWASIHYHARYGYPSGFQIRGEAQAGNLSTADTEQILLEVGWSPKWAAYFAKAWTGGSGSTGDKHVAKAQTQLWTTTHRSYIGREISDATATAALEAAGVAAASTSAVLALWQEERNLVRKSLTAAQVRKAWVEQVTDPALGRPFTEAEAVARLVELGYSNDDARVFLVE